MTKKIFHYLLFLTWLSFILGVVYLFASGTYTIQELHQYINALVVSWGYWGPLVFIFLYIVRGFILVPGSVMTVLAGILFGPIWGIMYMLIADVSSASVSYAVGYYLGNNLRNYIENFKTLHAKIATGRNNSFVAIVSLRLLFTPFDLVSYISGMLRISFSGYLLGTIIGSLPSVASLVWVGTAFNDPRTLLLSSCSFLIGLVLWAWLRKRAQKKLKKIQN